MMSKTKLAVVILCLLGLATSAFAEVINVYPDAVNATIQPAIDAANNGDTINVYPGSYTKEHAEARNATTGGVGPNNFNLFIDKEITLQGVDASGNPITNYSNAVASIQGSYDRPTFGNSSIFVQADNVVIQGLIVLQPVSPNKTVEIVGNNFTMKNCKVYGADGSCIYYDDMAYNTVTDESTIGSYEFSNNYFEAEYAWNVASGPGYNNGAATQRKITNNKFVSPRAICLTGKVNEPNSGWQWRLYPVGAATITGNDFTGCNTSVICRGNVYEDLDWAQVWNNNTFGKAVMTGSSAPNNCTADNNDSSFPNRRQITSSIQAEVARAAVGDTVLVKAGIYAEAVNVNKALTILGAQKNVPGYERTGDESIIQPVSGNGFTSNADNVIINGFKLIGTSAATGIQSINTHTGSQFINNVIQGFGFGFSLWNTSNFKLENNNIIADLQPIYINFGNGNAVDGSIKNNHLFVSDPQNGVGINMNGNGQTNLISQLSITNNTIEHGQIVLFGVNASSIAQNNIDAGNCGTGIYIGGYCSTLTIDNNTITNAPAPSSSGISITKYPTYQGNTNITLSNNTISNCAFGINILAGAISGDASNVTLTNNTISTCPIGIRLLDTLTTGTLNLGSTVFGSGLTSLITLQNWATNVTATGCNFGTTSNSEIEAKVYHKLDDPALGLVNWGDTRRATAITAADTASMGGSALLSARLTIANVPISGATVTFTCGTNTATVVTDLNGTATTTLAIGSATSYSVVFAGTANYTAASDTAAITVLSGKTLTWNQATKNLMLDTAQVNASGWYTINTTTGARVYITVTKGLARITGVITQFDADNADGGSIAVVSNSVYYNWQLKSGQVFRLYQSSMVNGVSHTASYYAASSQTLIDNLWYNGAYKLGILANDAGNLTAMVLPYNNEN